MALLLALQLTGVLGWPSGAPEKVCDSMLPSHGQNQPRSAGVSPFVITQSHSTVQPGDRVKGEPLASAGCEPASAGGSLLP